MDKKVLVKNGKTIYLLGKRKSDGLNVYLKKASWDCDWHWGFGYLETYTNNDNPMLARDICTHSHFDSDIIKRKHNTFENFKEYFETTTLNDDEIWELCDYMNTFYTLREGAEIFGRGYSYYTGRAKIEEIKQQEIADNINENMLPKLFEKIEKLLTPKQNIL